MHCLIAGAGVHVEPSSLPPLLAEPPLAGGLLGSGAGVGGVTQVSPAIVVQVQLDGQSLSVVQSFGVAWQLEVVTAGQLQVTGGRGSVGAGPASCAGVEPFEPSPEPLFGAEPGDAHAHTSGVHVKPSPQSASALHGTSYFGKHWLTVLGAQVSAGCAQFSPAGHGVLTAQPSICV